MLFSEPIVGSFHRLFGSDGCLFFYRESCDESSDLCVVHVYNGEVSIIPSFLHSMNRELQSGNPTKHVSVTAIQVHELLKAIEKHIGRTLHEEGPQETLEVLHSVVRVIQTLSIEKSLVDSYFSF